MLARNAYPLTVGFVVLLGMVLYYNLCGACASNPSPSQTYHPKERIESSSIGDVVLNVSYRNEYSAEYTSGFPFNRNSGRLLIPLDSGLHEFLLDLLYYLEAQPGKALAITGLYTSDEFVASPHPDLGLARALAVRAYLRNHGVHDSRRLIVLSLIRDSLEGEEGKLLNPVELKLMDFPNRYTEQMDSIRNRFRFDPLRLPFLYADSPVVLEDEQRKKLTELIACLEYYPELKCEVIGFTDSRGSASVNFQFGKLRAEFVRKYLIALGIGSDRIEISSRGERNPVATNETPEGRSANRRVEISLTGN